MMDHLCRVGPGEVVMTEGIMKYADGSPAMIAINKAAADFYLRRRADCPGKVGVTYETMRVLQERRDGAVRKHKT